jgi:hypothetical protein
MLPRPTNPKHRVIVRIFKLYIVFALSGIIHLNASLMFGRNNKPFSGQFLFFFLQAIGVSMQLFFQAVFISNINMGLHLRQLTNIFLCCVWVFFTFPLLFDDFTRCGFWRYQSQQDKKRSTFRV